MWKPAVAIVGALALMGALVFLFGGTLVASATGSSRHATNPTQNAAPNADTTSSTGTATTDADCVGDAHGKQPNGDNSHEFTAANMPPGKEKHCPNASVPEVPAAAGLLGLLMLVGAGFLVKTGHLRLPVTGSA